MNEPTEEESEDSPLSEIATETPTSTQGKEDHEITNKKLHSCEEGIG
jgi:hypothetical protein